MTFSKLVSTKGKGAWAALITLILITVLSSALSWAAQSGFGKVKVTRIKFPDENGKIISAKLMIPRGVDENNQAPGVIYLHGYQNNKETNAPYCIEAARRGIVVLNIDTLGRGKSQVQIDENKKGFDPLYGAKAAWEYLLELPQTDPKRCALMGHSLGAEMVYQVAVEDDREAALVTSGFAWRKDSTYNNPANMLMIFGKYDEYRKRMSGTKDFESEWMNTEIVKNTISAENPQFNKIYGSFKEGTARMVYMPDVTHIRESFDPGSIGTAMEWLEKSLEPDPSYSIDPHNQIWRIKEIASFTALISGIFMLIPLSLILIRGEYFRKLRNSREFVYSAGKKDIFKYSSINALLLFLYLPMVLVLFGFHVYVLRVDFVFPLMMVNGVVIWFLTANGIGALLYRKWRKKGLAGKVLLENELGDRIDKSLRKTTFIYAAALFAAACLLEWIMEGIFATDYRYIFPYASSFTPLRFLLFIEYSLLFYPGFIQLERFLFVQLRLKEKENWVKTWVTDSVKAILIIVIPLIIMMAVQYIPLYTKGIVPIVGPGASLIGFIMNLEHMIVLMSLILPLGAWLYRLTGSTYPAAISSAMIVAWFFTTSSVIAPIPV